MRKIREVLRLYFTAALSIRAIARSLGTSPSTVGEYLRRAKVAGLSWPLPEQERARPSARAAARVCQLSIRRTARRGWWSGWPGLWNATIPAPQRPSGRVSRRR